MRSANQSRSLRVLVPILLVLLALQFEFGMAVNLAGPPSLAPFGFSLAALSAALGQAGTLAVIHAVLGGLLVILSVLAWVLSLASKVRTLQVFGSLAFLSTVLAASTGLLFVLSGFQNDGDSHGMATNFILAFAFYFLELYFLKPGDRPDRSRRL
ncbi:MAG: hypothetical protein ABSB61_10735 [Anaerolineales bacterium]